jgi:CubicO group peptidase (beta-lactamase class C family)
MRLPISARTALGFAALILAGCTSPAAPRLGELSRSYELLQVLAAYNQDVRAPAWAAAVVRDGKVVAVAGIGVRNADTGTRLDVDTAMFHWGSVTKSVTATMISALVMEGTLSWRATLPELLPDVPMREEYRGVTLASLLDHRADLPPYTRLGPDEARRFAGYTGTHFDKRAAFLHEVLQELPPARSDALVYSNAGPAIAAHVAEVITGKSWEELVRAYVFEPLRMRSAGFGLPADAAPDQTRGHGGADADSLVVMDDAPLPASPMMDPAGNIRSTVYDLALYARAHLLGLRNEQGPLYALAVQDLHADPGDGRTMGRDSDGYAMGWGLRREGNQEVVHWHNGSAGQFFAEVDIYPQDDLAIVIMSNAAFPGLGAPELIRRIRNLYVGQ